MSRRKPWFQMFLVGASLGALHCEKSEMERMCDTLCQGLGCADFDVDKCSAQCLEREDDASEVGDACAKANRLLVECLSAPLSCGEYGDWFNLKGRAADYPCRAETDDFLVKCPDLWFEDPEP